MKKFVRALALAELLLVSQLVAASSDGSCVSALGLGVLQNGMTTTGYTTPMSQAGAPCVLATVTCIDGELNGLDLYPTCTDITPGR